MLDFNFVSKNITTNDFELFFGDDEIATTIQNHWIMAHVMAEAGIFSSVGQARKNGWNKPIPDGFSEHIIGKKKTQVTILNKKDDT